MVISGFSRLQPKREGIESWKNIFFLRDLRVLRGGLIEPAHRSAIRSKNFLTTKDAKRTKIGKTETASTLRKIFLPSSLRVVRGCLIEPARSAIRQKIFHHRGREEQEDPFLWDKA